MFGNYHGPESLLPFADKLSPDEKKKWTAEWRRTCWRSPRFLSIFTIVGVGCLTFFALFMPAWEFTPGIPSRCVFGLAELGVTYLLAEFVAFGFNTQVIAERISSALRKNEKTA